MDAAREVASVSEFKFTLTDQDSKAVRGLREGSAEHELWKLVSSYGDGVKDPFGGPLPPFQYLERALLVARDEEMRLAACLFAIQDRIAAVREGLPRAAGLDLASLHAHLQNAHEERQVASASVDVKLRLCSIARSARLERLKTAIRMDNDLSNAELDGTDSRFRRRWWPSPQFVVEMKNEARELERPPPISAFWLAQCFMMHFTKRPLFSPREIDNSFDFVAEDEFHRCPLGKTASQRLALVIANRGREIEG